MSCKDWRFFVHCSVSECLANQQATVLELSLLVAVFVLNRTIWQDFIAFLWFILPGATFLVTFSILLNWNKENLLLNHTYAYRMCGIDPYSMLLNYQLTKLEGRTQWPKTANSWTSLHMYLLLFYFDTKWILLFTIYQFSFLDTRTTSWIEKKYPRLWCGGGENQTITRNS